MARQRDAANSIDDVFVWSGGVHALIDENENLPSGPGLRHRFGRPAFAYRLIGYMPDTDVSSVETDRHLRQKYPAMVQEVGLRLPQLGVHVDGTARARPGTCRPARARRLVRLEESYRPDIATAPQRNEVTKRSKPTVFLRA